MTYISGPIWPHATASNEDERLQTDWRAWYRSWHASSMEKFFAAWPRYASRQAGGRAMGKAGAKPVSRWDDEPSAHHTPGISLNLTDVQYSR